MLRRFAPKAQETKSNCGLIWCPSTRDRNCGLVPIACVFFLRFSLLRPLRQEMSPTNARLKFRRHQGHHPAASAARTAPHTDERTAAEVGLHRERVLPQPPHLDPRPRCHAPRALTGGPPSPTPTLPPGDQNGVVDCATPTTNVSQRRTRSTDVVHLRRGGTGIWRGGKEGCNNEVTHPGIRRLSHMRLRRRCRGREVIVVKAMSAIVDRSSSTPSRRSRFVPGMIARGAHRQSEHYDRRQRVTVPASRRSPTPRRCDTALGARDRVITGW